MADTVRVVHAPAGAAPVELVVPFSAGMTLEQVVRASGIALRCPEIDLATMKIGTWGKLRDPVGLPAPGDRIEIYRPLSADPKASRARRARKKAAKK